MFGYIVLSKYLYRIFLHESTVNPLKKAFTFLTVSSIFVGITGFFQAFAGYILLGAAPNLFLCLAVFLMTFGVYSLNKLTDIGEDAINTPERLRFLAGKRTQVLYISLGAYAFSVVVVLLKLPHALPVVFVPLAANALYSSRLIPGIPRLKDIPVMKNVTVALSWSLVCTLIPAMDINAPIRVVMLLAYFMAARVFVNTVIFDTRDVDGDRANGIRTLPVILGQRRTAFILLAVNSTLIPWLVAGECCKLMAAITVLYGYAIIFCFRRRRQPQAMELFVDGEWLMACLLFLMIKLAFLS